MLFPSIRGMAVTSVPYFLVHISDGYNSGDFRDCEASTSMS